MAPGREPAPVPVIDGLGALIDRATPSVQAVILDLWGVVHDGERLFDGVADCLAQLRRRGIVTCLLSNAPRRIASVDAKLAGLGLPRSAYDHVLSSGEASHQALLARADAPHRGLGGRCFHLGPERDQDVWRGLPLDMADGPEDASFVLCTGIDAWEETLEDHRPMLDRCLARRLPMLCANPDLEVMVGPIRAICAGAMAAYYQERGGVVIYHGKPHAAIYRTLMARAGLDDPSRVVAVGDSVRTDIAGARALGMASVLCASGIHTEQMTAPGKAGAIDGGAVAALAERYGARPDAAMAELCF